MSTIFGFGKGREQRVGECESHGAYRRASQAMQCVYKCSITLGRNEVEAHHLNNPKSSKSPRPCSFIMSKDGIWNLVDLGSTITPRDWNL
jgi:hypothetical protein